MNEDVVRDVFSVYEVLKDALKVTRRSIDREIYTLHNRTIFLGEKKDDVADRLSAVESDLDDIMILSLFASFERELRVLYKTSFLAAPIKILEPLKELPTLPQTQLKDGQLLIW